MMFGASGLVLAGGLVWGLTGLPAFGDFQGEYGWILIDVASSERHVGELLRITARPAWQSRSLSWAAVALGATVGVAIPFASRGRCSSRPADSVATRERGC